MNNQQFRKKYHSQLVRRSQIVGKRLNIGKHGVTKRWASKLATHEQRAVASKRQARQRHQAPQI